MTYLSNQEGLSVANMNAEGVQQLQPRIEARSAATLGNERTRNRNPEGVADAAGLPVLNWDSQNIKRSEPILLRNPFRVGPVCRDYPGSLITQICHCSHEGESAAKDQIECNALPHDRATAPLLTVN